MMSVLAALCIMLMAACYCDYRKKKIPNFLIAVTALLGVGWRFLREGPGGVICYLLQSLLVMALLYFLFRLGTLGAGDVKLFGVTAGYLPFSKILIFLFLSLLIAAIISLVKLWKQKNFSERLRYLAGYLSNVWEKGRWRLYLEQGMDATDAGICLSGPIFLSLLLYLGGVY